eukprot:gene9743-13109_t
MHRKWNAQYSHQISLISTSAFKGYQQSEAKVTAYSDAKAIHANSSIAMPCIILVNPFLAQNVGSVARSMLNFGLTELRVVQPNCDILSENARALAAGAYELLENAVIYESLQECVQDLNRIMATTIRPRHMAQIIYHPSKAADIAVNFETNTKVGIMFGRERNGLSNDEIALADSIITIPSFPSFSSLNLAQAVNIVGYELWNKKISLEQKLPPDIWLQQKHDGDRLASREEVANFLNRIEKSLEVREYQTDEGRKTICFRNIRNVFQRTLMTRSEVDLLHGVLTSLNRSPEDK